MSIEAMKDIVRIQGYEGSWNSDPYMHGMYNGMELMLSLAELRQPVFRDAPHRWLSFPYRVCQPIISILYKLERFYRRYINPYKIEAEK